jgi:hypothetical protein
MFCLDASLTIITMKYQKLFGHKDAALEMLYTIDI